MAKAAQKQLNERNAKLNQFAVDIEFLLISVIQGVALGTLASNAAKPIGDLQFEYWLYIASGFLFILNFWSQAIIHTVSFIDWPLDLTHNFLYFLVSLIEVTAFAHVTNPLLWFAFVTAFFAAATILYAFDLSLIKKQKEKFSQSQWQKRLYDHILRREQFELKAYLPIALLFNLIAVFVIYRFTAFFLVNQYHLLLIALQVFFNIVFLFNSMRNFQKRSELITQSLTH